MSTRKLVWFCGVLMSLSAFSIDITLPFFTDIASDLDTPLSILPLTVTVFLFALGVTQLFFGIVSDAIGRRYTLLFGLGLFVSGSLLALTAKSFAVLLLARAIQGAGASAAYTLSRAILRDLSSGAELAKHMAVAAAIFAIGPMLAPLLAGLLILNELSWLWVFVSMTIYSSALLAFCVILLPETNRYKDASAIKLKTISERLQTVFANRQSRWFMGVHAVCQTSMILIVATMAPLYENSFGVRGLAFALFFAVHTIGILIGQVLNHHLIDRFGPLYTAMIATGFMITSGALVTLAGLTDIASPWLVSGLVTLFAVGYLSAAANTTALVMMPHAEIAGFTAAIHGALTLLFAAVASSLIGQQVQADVTRWGLALTVLALSTLILMTIWARQQKAAPVIP